MCINFFSTSFNSFLRKRVLKVESTHQHWIWLFWNLLFSMLVLRFCILIYISVIYVKPTVGQVIHLNLKNTIHSFNYKYNNYITTYIVFPLYLCCNIHYKCFVTLKIIVELLNKWVTVVVYSYMAYIMRCITLAQLSVLPWLTLNILFIIQCFYLFCHRHRLFIPRSRTTMSFISANV